MSIFNFKTSRITFSAIKVVFTTSSVPVRGARHFIAILMQSEREFITLYAGELLF